MKTKKKVAKPTQVKSSKSKVSNLAKTPKKPVRRAPLATSSAKSPARPVKQSPSLKPVAVAKSGTVVAVSVTERIAASRLVKSDGTTKSTKLKLVTKAVVKGAVVRGAKERALGAKIPATKITRSEPTSMGSKVISAHFSFEAPKPAAPARAITAEKPAPTAVLAAGSVSFKPGDKIVYPGHGVGEIEGIRSTVLGGQEHHIYNIKIIESGMKVMVPVSQAPSVGLRKIVDKRAIEEVYAILKDRDFKIDTQTWNRRFREYTQKIKTGSVFEIAMVLRDLSVLSADKELSFGEKKMLDQAEALLVSEIAIAKARPHEKVVGELRALFA
mgnify:CR=1 FL=1